MSNSTPHRPSWDETWLTVARTVAQRSLCDRDKVGAVIVSKSNRLLETGYNGPPSGFATGDVGCGSWCTRAQMIPSGWRATPGGPNVTLEYDDGKIYAVRSDGRRVAASDDALRQMGFQPIFDLTSDYSDCPSLHAEANALMRGDRSAREGGTIYVTSGVCWGCAKLIANSGLDMVVVAADTIITQVHRNAVKSYEFLESCGITVVTG